MKAEERIREFIGNLYLSEPLYQSVALSHKFVADESVKTVAIGNRKVRYNPKFIEPLRDGDFKFVIFTELDRILLKHPYERSRKNKMAHWYASSIAINEATDRVLPKGSLRAEDLRKKLVELGYTEDQKKFMDLYEKYAAMPEEELKRKTGMTREKLASMRSAMAIPTSSDFEKRSLEYYYNVLDKHVDAQEALKMIAIAAAGQKNPGDNDGEGEGKGKGENGDGKNEEAPGMDDYNNPENAGDLAKDWAEDVLAVSDINSIIREAAVTNRWGSVRGNFKEALIASLNPKVDFKAILRSFRQTITSSEYSTNRMRPNRRYGFGFPGRKHEYTTRLAMFVDTSGSVSVPSLCNACGCVNKIFQHGIKDLDVYWFDADVDKKPIRIKRVSSEFKATGRGGTSFQAVFDFLNNLKTRYDGVIVFTDGYCPAPKLGKIQPRDVCWLIDTERHYDECKEGLAGLGRVAFVRGVDDE